MWSRILIAALLAVALARAEIIADGSEVDEALLQQMLDELNLADVEEQQDEPDDEKMFRYRKEGQISVYNYAPSIRDQEYLEHSSLWGHQYMAGGAGEGMQRLKPDGSGRNVQVVKSDAVLPAYCNPPNPCPVGYTSDDGCLEDFENTAAFSRQFQQSQDCMCDTEHMFDCPGSTKEDEVNTLARQISNEGLMESALDRISHHLDNEIPVEGQHKSLVAKKFFNKETHEEYTRMLSEKNKLRTRRSIRADGKKPNATGAASKKARKFTKIELNPYLMGEKLPVVAKKG